jgi:hypothetical protein
LKLRAHDGELKKEILGLKAEISSLTDEIREQEKGSQSQANSSRITIMISTFGLMFVFLLSSNEDSRRTKEFKNIIATLTDPDLEIQGKKTLPAEDSTKKTKNIF